MLRRIHSAMWLCFAKPKGLTVMGNARCETCLEEALSPTAAGAAPFGTIARQVGTTGPMTKSTVVSADVAAPNAGAAQTFARKPRLRGSIAVAALGVVFGDIGTSPLYTLKTCFTSAHVQPAPENVLGIMSVLLWTLVLVVCVKYVTFVMHADYKGEGGIFALLARLLPEPQKGIFAALSGLAIIGVVGAATLFGDGLITPAISVLSAVEGLNGLTPAAVRWEVPITIAILIGLFLVQSRGTQKVGIVFGPVMALWFLAIAITGGVAVVQHPQILWALNPGHAGWFLTHHGILGFLVLGGTVLAVTGVEALYADMSHFGRVPITFTWYSIVFPALLLNYLGQGGVVLGAPKALDNAFYALTPGWLLVPMVLLATAATVIASQALISGAFTLVEQGIALNFVPRMRVVHTADRYPGQVYVPAINTILAMGCVALVATFRTSDALASAYGLAVSLTMAATTVLYASVLRRVMKTNAVVAGVLFLCFICMDGSFVLAGLAKIPTGGWLPLAIGAVLLVLMTTWHEGRRRVLVSLGRMGVPVSEFLAELPAKKPVASDGTAVFLTGNPVDVPFTLKNHWVRQGLNERLVLLTLEPNVGPYVDEADRVRVESLSDSLVRIRAQFGFMEWPSLAAIVDSCAAHGIDLESENTSFVIARPQIVAGERPRMYAARRWLFDVMQKLAATLPKDMGIPADRLVELGVEVKL